MSSAFHQNVWLCEKPALDWGYEYMRAGLSVHESGVATTIYRTYIPGNCKLKQQCKLWFPGAVPLSSIGYLKCMQQTQLPKGFAGCMSQTSVNRSNNVCCGSCGSLHLSNAPLMGAHYHRQGIKLDSFLVKSSRLEIHRLTEVAREKLKKIT